MEGLERRMMLAAAVAPATPYLPPSRFLSTPGGYLSNASPEQPLAIAQKYLAGHAAQLGMLPGDANNPIVTDQYTDADTGVTHIYLQQRYNGLGVMNANLVVNVTRDGRILSVGGGFVSGLSVTPAKPIKPNLGPGQAIDAVKGFAPGGAQGYSRQSAGKVGPNDAFVAPALSLDPIVPQLYYVATPGGVNLAWNLAVRTPDHQHWYDLNVDAATGKTISGNDWVDHATYNVYPMPTESPNDGSRAVLTDPSDPTASPYGWHDTNGVTGPEYTDTRGNNVSAQEDTNADNSGGYRPDGGTGLNFNFPIDLTQSPSAYQAAAITNLFYWNNLLHDVHYQYGFTEVAGNFQTKNYTGQGLGNDAVQADAQDGSGTNNANFATPPDGQMPRMQMYLFTYTSPYRDGDLDGEIIAHEYGHGVTNRLTGGPANSNALTTVQAGGMGEGWSDFYALMFTQKPTDTKMGKYPQGTYVLGQSPTGAGIRRYPYSYDMTVDPETINYFNTDPNREVHNTGEIWATTLWDLNWLLIDKYGYSADITHGYDPSVPGKNGGNNLAFQLVEDALKLQPANPSFKQARDAILQADQVRTGGANQLQIWQAFARRGMGYSFVDASSSSTTVTAAYDLPVGLLKPRVASQSPVGVQYSSPDHIDFVFSKAMNPASFAVADDISSFTGPGGTDLKSTITGATWLNSSTTLRVSFAPVGVDGTYTMVIGPQILAADDGSAMDQNADGTGGQVPQDQYSASFGFDSQPLEVTGTTPAAGSGVQTPFTSIDVHFVEAYDPATLGIGNLTLSQGTVTSATAVDATTARYTLSGVTTEGTLTLTMGAGALKDTEGFPLISFTATYGIDVGTRAMPAVTAVGPAGSLVYQTSTTGVIGSAGDTDAFTLQLAAGETIAAWARPAASLQAGLTLLDPSGAMVATTTGTSAGTDCLLQAVPTVAGTYTLVVSGMGATTGTYSVAATLNAMLETEAHGGARDDTLATAQDLDPSLQALGPTGSRGAVVGSLGSPGGSSTITADFTSGADGFVVDNTGGGLWHLSIGHGTQSGHTAPQSFYYGTGETASGGGTFQTGSTRNTGTLTSPSFIVGSAASNPQVTFNYILLTEKSTVYDLAQLQISVNGGTWTTLASYNLVAESSTWKAATPVSLLSYAGQSVRLRFFFDTVDGAGNGYEGWYVDDVVVSAAQVDSDYYKLTLQAGQRLTAAVQGLGSGSNVSMTLLDSAGNLITTGSAADNASAMISDYAPNNDGVYYLKVTGTAGSDYNLLVTRDASFDREPNNTTTTPQDITSTGVALGSVETSITGQVAGETFESGTLGPSWTTYSSNSYGRILVTNAYPPAGGAYALIMDSNVDSYYALNEAVWTVNLAGVKQATLSFYEANWNDETETLPADFTGHYNGDGVSISGDGGVTWHTILSGPTGTAGSWYGHTYDLVAAAAAKGWTLGNNFKIKFQQYDNYTMTTDGRGYDSISITGAGPGEDVYSVQLAAGDSLHLSTTTPGDTPGGFNNTLDPAIDVYDPAGNLVASDDNSAPDGKNALLDLTAATTGAYKIRVRAAGGTAGEYVLDTHQYLLPNGATARPDLLAAADTGLSNTDNLTRYNNATPATALRFTIPGTVPGATVTLYCDGTPVASATAAGFSTLLTLDGATALSDGPHVFIARQTPSGGVESPDSDPLTVTVMTGTPSTPGGLTLQAASDSGISNSDGVTKDVTPTFDVANTAAYFLVYRNGVLYRSEYESGTTYTAPAAADGSWTYTITAVDVAGNESAASPATTVVIDTVAPAAPTAGPDLEAGSDSGISSTDNITNVATPVLDVAGAPYWRVYRNGVLISGSYETGTTFSPTLADGSASYVVKSVDAAGNESAASPALSLTIDTQAPATPAAPDLEASSDGGGSNTDNVTNIATPVFDVAGAPYFRIFRDGVQVSGDWMTGTTYTSAALSDGSYAFAVQAVDAAGNVSSISPALNVTIDSTILQAPTLYSACDTGYSNSDRITSFNNSSADTALYLIVPGTTAGATLRVYADGVLVGSGIATGGTSVVATDGSTVIPDGVRQLTIRQQLPGGPESLDSNPLNVTIMTAAPAAPNVPDLPAEYDSGVSNADNITNVNTPPIAVTGTTYYRLLVDAQQVSGDWQTGNFTLLRRVDGTYAITAVAVDAAGNVSAPSAPLMLTIDTRGPVTAAAPDLQAASDSGYSNSDNITRITTPTFDLPAIPAGCYWAMVRSQQLVTTYYQTGTTYTVPSPLADGSWDFSLILTDAAGNQSGLGAILTIRIDTTAPTLPYSPEMAISSDSGLSSTDGITNVTRPQMGVRVNEAGMVHLELDGSNGTGPAVFASGPGGAIFPDLGQTLSDGTHTFIAWMEDLAGNRSANSSARNIVIDTVAPAAPAVPDLLSSSDSGVSNTDNITNVNTPAITVVGPYYRLFLNGAQVSNDYQGGAVTLARRNDGVYTVTAVAVDEAGNVSAPSAPLTLTIDTVAPLPPLTAPDLQAGSDTGVSSTDHITSDTTPSFDIPGVGSSYYRVYRSGAQISGDYQTGTPFTAPAQADGTALYTWAIVDAAGNVSMASPGLSVTIDTAAPSVTVTPVTTDNPTPALGGAISDPAATVLVTVAGKTYPAVNSGTGWSLAAGIISPALAAGTYDVQVSATDLAGNIGTDTTMAELTVLPAPPVMNPEPVTTKGTSNTVSWAPVPGADEYEVEYDTDPAFGSPDGSSGWILPTSFTFNGLTDGTQYYYHVRARKTWVMSTTWRQTSQVDFSADQLTNTSASNTPGAVTLAGGQTILFSDDFEDGDFNGWTVGTGAFTRQVTNQTAAGGQYSLTMIGGANTHYTGLSHSLASITPSHVSFAVRAASTSAYGTYVVLSSPTSAQAVFFYMGGGGQMGLILDTTPSVFTPYQANTWYTVDLDFNWASKSLSFSVDGKVVNASVPFRNTGATSLGTIYLYNYTSTQGWWDSISMGSGGGYATAGTLVSTLIQPGDHWDTLTFNTTQPAGTSLTVDILDAAGNVLAGNVASGADLTALGIPLVPIKLRANLATSNTAVSPSLLDWTVTGGRTDYQLGQWSTAVSSTQDATAPVVAVDGLTTIDTTPALSGTIDDPTATVSVTVNGQVYAAQNLGKGTWVLADNAISPALPTGALTVTATATDPAGNAATASGPLTILPPPSLVNWVVNDGSAQRSMVNSLTLTFDQAVSLGVGALEVHPVGGSDIPLAIANPLGDGRTYLLTFSGSGIVAGELNDGVYQLILHHAKIHDLFSRTPVGADETYAFIRLFGDSDGNGTVDSIDTAAFAAAQESKLGESNYRWYFDSDQDQDVDGLDALFFRQHEGMTLN